MAAKKEEVKKKAAEALEKGRVMKATKVCCRRKE